MPKYLVLYNSPTPAAKMMANSTPEQMQAGLKMWTDWSNKVGGALVDFGNPLDEGKRVDEKSSVSDSDSQATGFSIIEAASLDDAVKLVEGHPHLHTPGGASIDVLPFIQMQGM